MKGNAPHVVRIQRHFFRVYRQEAEGHPSLHEGVVDSSVKLVARTPGEAGHCSNKTEDRGLFKRQRVLYDGRNEDATRETTEVETPVLRCERFYN